MMRAKMQVRSVTKTEHAEELVLFPVTSKPFNADNVSEDNTYSKWSPSGELRLTVTNPALHGRFTPGEKYYLDFTKAAD
jgi:hypothetical protein